MYGSSRRVSDPKKWTYDELYLPFKYKAKEAHKNEHEILNKVFLCTKATSCS